MTCHERLFHLVDRDDWDPQATEHFGSTRGLTLADVGFIHLSTASQLAGVIDRFYDDVRTRLLVLEIDPALLPSGALRYDDVAGERFPHLYAPLPTRAVLAAQPLVR